MVKATPKTKKASPATGKAEAVSMKEKLAGLEKLTAQLSKELVALKGKAAKRGSTSDGADGAAGSSSDDDEKTSTASDRRKLVKQLIADTAGADGVTPRCSSLAYSTLHAPERGLQHKVFLKVVESRFTEHLRSAFLSAAVELQPGEELTEKTRTQFELVFPPDAQRVREILIIAAAVHKVQSTPSAQCGTLGFDVFVEKVGLLLGAVRKGLMEQCTGTDEGEVHRLCKASEAEASVDEKIRRRLAKADHTPSSATKKVASDGFKGFAGRCFICKKPGHKADHCTSKAAKSAQSAPKPAANAAEK